MLLWLSSWSHAGVRALLGNSIEKIDDAAFQRILRADDEQPLVANELLDDFRPVPQVIHGGANIRADCLMDQFVQIVSQVRCQQILDRRPYQVDDRMEVV